VCVCICVCIWVWQVCEWGPSYSPESQLYWTPLRYLSRTQTDSPPTSSSNPKWRNIFIKMVFYSSSTQICRMQRKHLKLFRWLVVVQHLTRSLYFLFFIVYFNLFQYIASILYIHRMGSKEQILFLFSVHAFTNLQNLSKKSTLWVSNTGWIENKSEAMFYLLVGLGTPSSMSTLCLS